jgi:hypothetical protein
VAERAPLDVRLELPEQTASGGPLAGQLTVANVLDEPVAVASPASAAALTLVVLDVHWNVVAPQSVAKVHAAREETVLAPAESVTWDLAELSFVSRTAQLRYVLPPGSYHVLAVYHPRADRPGEADASPVVAVSNVERVEITRAAT